MISLEKWYILTRLQKMPKNVGDLGKFIVAKGFKKLPKVQKIAQSGHTAYESYKFTQEIQIQSNDVHHWQPPYSRSSWTSIFEGIPSRSI